MTTHAILLTGKPGVGKSTLIRRVVERLEEMGHPADGFYTAELSENGERVGFEIVTLQGKRGLLARFKLPGAVACIGKYGITLEALETIGVESIYRAIGEKKVIVIDEIAPMETASMAFCRAVDAAFESGLPILGAIVKRSTPFTDAIKARPGVEVIPVTLENRDGLIETVTARLVAVQRR